MTRQQAETISKALTAAVEPLATKEALTAAVESLGTKEELADAIRPLATKKELADAIKSLATKRDLAAVEERLGKDIIIMFEKTNSRIESTKVWLLGGLLVIALSIVVNALQVAAAAPGGKRGLETGQPIHQPSEATQSAVSDQTNLQSTKLLYV